MSDRFVFDPTRPDDGMLPAWVAALLREPTAPNAAAKARLMTRVRAAGVPRRLRPRTRPAWSGRRGLAPLAGLMAATLLGAVMLGLPRGAGVSSGAFAAAGLRDTLRLVRFVLVAPAATRLAVVGDFNGWKVDSTPMRMLAESTGVWAASVRLAPGAHRYAYVVDGARWVADPARPRAADTTDGARSTVTVLAESTAVRR